MAASPRSNGTLARDQEFTDRGAPRTTRHQAGDPSSVGGYEIPQIIAAEIYQLEGSIRRHSVAAPGRRGYSADQRPRTRRELDHRKAVLKDRLDLTIIVLSGFVLALIVAHLVV